MPARPNVALAVLLTLAALAMSLPPALAQDDRPATRPADAGGQEADAGDQGDVALTIYSTADPAGMDVGQLEEMRGQNPSWYRQNFPGFGVVRETRTLDLPEGRSVTRFEGVAAGIDPTTVQVTSLGAPVSVVEQSYEYDLLDATKLLEKFVGQTLELADRRGRVELLSVRGGSIVYRDLPPDGGETGPVRVQPSGNASSFVAQILFPDTAGLILRPTLVWDLRADEAGERPVRLTYGTTGMTWRADYNIVTNADDTAVDVSSWVTLVNQSGTSFDDARLKLVAGDVQRVTPAQPGRGRLEETMLRTAAAARDEAGFEDKAFFEYHLYTLGRRTDLRDNSTKQIELFEAARDVPAEKVFVYSGSPQFGITGLRQPVTQRDLGTVSNQQVDVYLSFKNAEDAGLGVPMPSGKLRVYKRDDADDTLEFVGEDVIFHTPREETVRVRLGSAFDIVGERRQTDFTVDERGRVITESFEVKVRNRKRDETVTVLVRERLFRWFTWEINRKSHDFEKQDAQTVHFPVTIEPNGEAVVTYTVRYTW